MGCWLLAGSPQYPAPQACHCGYEDVKSSLTADGLVFFGVWHPSKQPSQVIDLASWTCLSVFTSYYVAALVRWFWAAQPCHWPGVMCPLHWSSPPSGLYCSMLAWWIHPGRCFLAMPSPSGILPAFEGTVPCQFPQCVCMKHHNPVNPRYASDLYSQSDTWPQRLTWCVLVVWSCHLWRQLVSCSVAESSQSSVSALFA